MQNEDPKNLPEEKPSMTETATRKSIATKPITIRLQRLTRPMDEYESIQVEAYLFKENALCDGVLESTRIIDSSASVLHSQMHSLLTAEEPDVRRPGEWATELAIQCGKGIAELIRAKTEALRLLK